MIQAMLFLIIRAVIPRCAAPHWTAAIIVPVTRALARDSPCYNLVRT
jgi:hypothetical protein